MAQENKTDMGEMYDEIWGQDFKTDGIPHGWIQWKGTDVCIDLRCICGHRAHYDGDFFYAYECPKCHRKYAVGSNVKLIELNAEQIEYMADGSGFKTCELEED